MRLRVDRPCRVARVRGRWQWKCLCTPQVWSYTGSAATWTQAYRAAEVHMRLEHPKPAPVAPAVPLAAATTAPLTVVIELRPGLAGLLAHPPGSGGGARDVEGAA